MGSSAGTSIPFFLAHVAPEAIGLENEYCRILVDQGWVGLGGWLAFLGWLFVRPPPSRPADPWRIGVVLMYSLTLASWVSAFIGTGILSSVPGTVLLLTQMGVLVGVRARGAVPEAVSILPGAPSEGEGFSSPLPPCGEEPGSGGAGRLGPGRQHRLRIPPNSILPRKGEGRWNNLCHKSCGRSPWRTLSLQALGPRRSTQMTGWVLVAGDFTPFGGMDRANLALAQYLADRGAVHLVTHRAWDVLAAHPNVVVHWVPRPFGGTCLASRCWGGRAGGGPGGSPGTGSGWW